MPHALLTSGYDVACTRTSLAATICNGSAGMADFVNDCSTLAYNAQGMLTSIQHFHQSAPLETMLYAYDALDRVSTFQSNDGTATYGYDSVNEVTSANYTTADGGHQPADETYSFDLNGNRPAQNGGTVADNEVSDDGTFRYTFDADGNRLTRQRDVLSPPLPDDLVSYTWDARNRLTGVEEFSWNAASGAWVETEVLTYTYDVFDRLIERVDDKIGGSTTTTQYVWDDDKIVLSFDDGMLAARYLNGPNTSAHDQYFSTLAEEDVPTGTTNWDLLDNLGSLRDVIDSAGTVVDHLNYNTFGQKIYESAPSVSHIDGYAGGLYDPSTQLVYFIHRWYDPTAVVWTSFDPAGFAAGDANLSRYVGNDAANLDDPSGLFSDYGTANNGSTSKNFSQSNSNVFVFGFVGRGGFPDDRSTGTYQLLNGLTRNLKKCGAAPVTIAGFTHDVDKTAIDTQFDNWMKTAKNRTPVHVFLIGHSYGGSRAIAEAKRLRFMLKQSGFKPRIYLTTMDAIVRGGRTAQTEGPGGSLESFDNYYETSDPNIPGKKIKGATNHDVTNGVARVMQRPEYRNDSPHTAIDNLLAHGVYCRTTKGDFQHLYDLVPVLTKKIIAASTETDVENQQ